MVLSTVAKKKSVLAVVFPTKGRKRPVIFQIAAIVLVLAFLIPLITTLISLIKPQQETLPTNTKTSLKL
ncbi:MAG: hypothetical protein AAF349_21155 [Cyanobacteria bacterium P01_A01_bin.68]